MKTRKQQRPPASQSPLMCALAQQPGTPGAEKSTVTALVPVMSILLLHSTKGHQDHKDHNELAALDVN